MGRKREMPKSGSSGIRILSERTGYFHHPKFNRDVFGTEKYVDYYGKKFYYYEVLQPINYQGENFRLAKPQAVHDLPEDLRGTNARRLI
jgi:hypothetical protein